MIAAATLSLSVIIALTDPPSYQRATAPQGAAPIEEGEDQEQNRMHEVARDDQADAGRNRDRGEKVECKGLDDHGDYL